MTEAYLAGQEEAVFACSSRSPQEHLLRMLEVVPQATLRHWRDAFLDGVLADEYSDLLALCLHCLMLMAGSEAEGAEAEGDVPLPDEETECVLDTMIQGLHGHVPTEKFSALFNAWLPVSSHLQNTNVTA